MTRVGRWRVASVLIGLVVLVASCHRAPTSLHVHRVGPLAVGAVRSVAVLPFASAPEVDAAPSAPGQEIRAEPAATTVYRALTEAMRVLPEWKITDEITDEIIVSEAIRKLYGTVRSVAAGEAVAVGRLLGVDAVVYGTVRWLRARELAAMGAVHVAAAMHHVLYGGSATPVPRP